MKIFELSSQQARAFFLKSENYCTIELPQYYDFTSILHQCDEILKKHKLNDIANPNDITKVINDCTVVLSKTGNYQWRKLRIINPLLYVNLVNIITCENSWSLICKTLSKNIDGEYIHCCSFQDINEDESNKANSIFNWWSNFEQRMIDLSSSFSYMGVTDIENCYSSIYTHSISWALHGKELAKKERTDDLIGNQIDKALMQLSCGQTNGIPEGSTLMDLIAEIILTYFDENIKKELSYENTLEEYEILRYRDDFRIFSNSKHEMEIILKTMSMELANLSFRINSSKTFIYDNILEHVLKSDKMYLLLHGFNEVNIQKHLFAIWVLADKYQETGQVITELTLVYKKILFSKYIDNIDQLSAIIINIMHISSRYYPICIAFLSKFISIGLNREVVISKLSSKMSNLPNTEYLDLWVDRLKAGDFDNPEDLSLTLCKFEYNGRQCIYNFSWMKMETKLDCSVINTNKLNGTTPVVSANEVELFKNDYPFD